MVCTTIAEPIVAQSARSSGVPTLKWLVVPRHACATMMTSSSSKVATVVQLTSRRVFLHPGR